MGAAQHEPRPGGRVLDVVGTGDRLTQQRLGVLVLLSQDENRAERHQHDDCQGHQSSRLQPQSSCGAAHQVDVLVLTSSRGPHVEPSW